MANRKAYNDNHHCPECNSSAKQACYRKCGLKLCPKHDLTYTKFDKCCRNCAKQMHREEKRAAEERAKAKAAMSQAASQHGTAEGKKARKKPKWKASGDETAGEPTR